MFFQVWCSTAISFKCYLVSRGQYVRLSCTKLQLDLNPKVVDFLHAARRKFKWQKSGQTIRSNPPSTLFRRAPQHHLPRCLLPRHVHVLTLLTCHLKYNAHPASPGQRTTGDTEIARARPRRAISDYGFMRCST